MDAFDDGAFCHRAWLRPIGGIVDFIRTSAGRAEHIEVFKQEPYKELPDKINRRRINSSSAASALL
ncbi:hypothetical protein QKW52_18380 [Bacillus sonorensis]|nr:hypothetical protein [Bacillus sonorensis]GIN66545.1 hypothetical protein J41TS2_19660 [Bacillus sonorensis]